MDLTKSYPRSPHDKLAGIVMLPRTIDKARAYRAGTVGEYKYECPMDQDVFRFLGVDGPTLADKAVALDDAGIEEWLRKEHLAEKSDADIEKFNRTFLADMPEPGSDSEKRFVEIRNKLDPSRTDVTTWADLLDLEEGRLPRWPAA